MFRLHVVLALLVLLSGTARAQLAALPAEPQLGLLDPDAAVYVSGTPDAEVSLATWVRGLKGAKLAPALQKWVDGAGATFLRRLGFDGTRGFADSGLATEVPIVAGLFAVDAEASEAAFHARAEKPNDARAQAKAPRVWNRSRVVALVRDEKKLRAALAAFTASGTELVAVDGLPARLAEVFRADAKAGKTIAATLKRAKLLAVGRFSTPWGHDVLLFVRVLDKRWLVVDALWAFGGVPVDWKLDATPLTKLLNRKLGKENAATRLDLHALPGSAFASGLAGVYLRPERLIDLGKFIGWSNVLAAAAKVADVATARSVLDTGEREVIACEDFRPVATEGPLADVVLTAHLAADALVVDAYWSLRTPGALDAALATDNDGLIDMHAGTGQLVAVLWLAGTDGLRKLVRPGVLAQNRHAIDERARLCGTSALASLALVGWPQYLTLYFDGDAGTTDLFRGLRNLAFSVWKLGVGPKDTQMTVLGSVAQPVLHDDFDRMLKRSTTTLGKRKLTLWKGKPDEPWAVAAPATDGKRTVYGVVWGGNPTLSLLWGQPTPAPAPGPTPFIGLARVQLPWFAEALEPVLDLPGLGELAQGLTRLVATVKLEPQLLHVELGIQSK